MITRRTAASVEDHECNHFDYDHDHLEQSSELVLRKERKWYFIFALSFIGLTLSGLIPPHRAGFTCDDPNIRKSYHGDSISIYTLFGGVLLGPLILFAVTEAIHQSRHLLPFPSDNDKHSVGSAHQFDRKRRFFGRWRCLVGDYLLGFVYLLAVVELGKVMMGELRPHFLDTCQPDWTVINCSQGLVTNYVCLGDVPKWLKADMFKSFPSGHAALSAYAFVFSSIYSQIRISRTNYSHLLRSWIQLLFLLWACLCSLTRVTDNRHHWWDVLVGVFLGIVAAVFTAKCIVQNNFQPSGDLGAQQQQTTTVSRKRVNSNSMRMTEVKHSEPEKRITSL